ncbi:MAG: hypothetical protein QW761_02050 [Candidatus Aenigmatarchaeota archaeon]
MKKYFTPSTIARLIASGLLLWALARHAYGYYQILRWVVCGAGAYSAYTAMESKKTSWAWALGITAVLFNPIIPIHLNRDSWAIIDIAAAILIGVSTFFCAEKTITA